MKRILTMALIVAWCLAAIGCAAFAEGEDELHVDMGTDSLILSDDAAISGDDLELELDPGSIDVAEALSLDLQEALQNDVVDGKSPVSNKTVIKKYIRYKIEDGEASVVSADRAVCEADIPETIKGCKVTSIAPGAFAGCNELWTVTIPKTVTEVGEAAFSDCAALVFVTLPEGLERVGDYAFRNCPMISHFELPEGMVEISEGMFENCTKMWKIAFPSTLRKIGDAAFYNCKALKEFSLPGGLEEIGESAFEGCSDMRKVTIPAGVEDIPELAFKNCSELNIVTLNEGLKTIGMSAFGNCKSMRSIKLPNSVQFIDKLAFAYCEEMTTLKIPGGVESLGYGAFFHCVDVQEVYLNPGVKQIGDYCFAECKKLAKVEIPESVDLIGKEAFTLGRAARVDKGEVQMDAPLKQPRKLKIYGRKDTAAYAYAKSYGIPFVVKKIPATGLSIAEGKTMTSYVGVPVQLTAVQEPSNAEMDVKWESSSSSVSVSKTGLLTPKHSGKATITARTENDKKATIEVKVIDAKSVSIDEGKSLTMKVGETLQLNATVLPEQVNSKLTWSSGSKRIATVSKTGLVKAKKKGTVTITVRTANKKKAKITIKVVR
ncbi:MAG: leucine-rich repeat protein [Clostridia bacterium]|nr:leucine-rich repeat protein [Clostridia bacterium]MBQ6325977.1 leucine-rich repeat protein [Clostridia bacterium]